MDKRKSAAAAEADRKKKTEKHVPKVVASAKYIVAEKKEYEKAKK